MSKPPYSHEFTNWSKFTSTKLFEKLTELGIEAKKGKARRQAQLNVYELGISSDVAEERLEALYGMRLPEAQALAKQYRVPTGNGRLFDLIKHIFIYEHLVLQDNKRTSNANPRTKSQQNPPQSLGGKGRASGLTSIQDTATFLRGGAGRTDRRPNIRPDFSQIQPRALGHDSMDSSPHEMLTSLRNSQARHQAAVAEVLHNLEGNLRTIRENMVSVKKIGEASEKEFKELITMLEEKMSLYGFDSDDEWNSIS